MACLGLFSPQFQLDVNNIILYQKDKDWGLTGTNRGQWGPTGANRGQQGPTGANRGQQGPTGANGG